MPDAIWDASGDASGDASADARSDAAQPMDEGTPGASDDAAAPDAAPIDAALPDAAPPDAALDPGREHRCDDGLDDDSDGAVDCFDGDCLDDVPCNIVPETPVQFVQELFLQRCGCHTGAVDLGGLQLVRPFTDTTVGVPAVLDPEWMLIEPGDPAASLLYVKLLDDIPDGLGERMPPEMPYLDADQLALVADWIAGLRP